MRPSKCSLRIVASSRPCTEAPRQQNGTKPLLSRAFSSTSSTHAQRPTLQRQQMFEWLKGPGKAFKDPLPGSSNYLNAYDSSGQLIRAKKTEEDSFPSAVETELEKGEEEENIPGVKGIGRERPEDLRPFPDNVHFRSQNVLSEPLKQQIFQDVTEKNVTIREASQKYGVEMRRVAAVIRLKTIEADWVIKGKQLAVPYARAVMDMLPQTLLNFTHEPINDLPVHRATASQMFYPVAESRQFTRVDAGEVFQRGLLPADERIPHPQMVRALRDSSLPSNATKRAAELQRQMRVADSAAEQRARRRETRRAKNTTLVAAPRADFAFEDVAVTRQSTGRLSLGIGQRYGVPHQDRKKGQVKIPRKVE